MWMISVCVSYRFGLCICVLVCMCGGRTGSTTQTANYCVTLWGAPGANGTVNFAPRGAFRLGTPSRIVPLYVYLD